MKKRMLVNHDIRSRRVVVIDETGRRLGEFMKKDAIAMAQDRGLDLVEVSDSYNPKTERYEGPSTCKMMDYGKYIYDSKKKARASRAASSRTKTKEVRVTPRIADGDLEVRAKRIREFVSKGSQVKVSMKFKGADMRHVNIGRQRCQDLIDMVADVTVVEQSPKMSGRFMNFVLAPKS